MQNLLSQMAPVPTGAPYEILTANQREIARDMIHFMSCEILQPTQAQADAWETELTTWTDATLAHYANECYLSHPSSDLDN